MLSGVLRSGILEVDMPIQRSYHGVISLYTMNPIVDYAPAIRAELEREIGQLKEKMEGNGQVWFGDNIYSEDDVKADRASVGYLINLHHGIPVIYEGEVLAGLPVSIDSEHPRAVRVFADQVPFLEDSSDVDRASPDWTYERRYFKDLVEESIW